MNAGNNAKVAAVFLQIILSKNKYCIKLLSAQDWRLYTSLQE